MDDAVASQIQGDLWVSKKSLLEINQQRNESGYRQVTIDRISVWTDANTAAQKIWHNGAREKKEKKTWNSDEEGIGHRPYRLHKSEAKSTFGQAGRQAMIGFISEPKGGRRSGIFTSAFLMDLLFGIMHSHIGR